MNVLSNIPTSGGAGKAAPLHNQGNERLISSAEAALILGVHENTFLRYIKNRTVPLTPIKLGRTVRYSRNALIGFIEAKAQNTGS